MSTVPIPGTPNSPTDLKLPPPTPDPSRIATCKHGQKATPKRVHPAFRGHGYWQNFAEGCAVCDGAPAGIPYKPA